MADTLYTFLLMIAVVVALLCGFVIVSIVRGLMAMPDPLRMSDAQAHEAAEMLVVAVFAAIGLFCGGGWIFAAWWAS